MASTTTCPTVTPCPTTGYRFEPTGTFNPATNWTNVNTPFDAAFFPPTKTYSSIFNKDTMTPNMPPCPSTMMPMPVAMPPMMPMPTTTPMVPPMTPVMTPYMTPMTPMTWFNAPMTPMPTMPLPTWCMPPMTTPYGPMPTTYPVPTYPTVFPMPTPFGLPTVDTPVTPFGLPTTCPVPTTNDLCSMPCRPTNPVELYCLTNPIRVCDREGNRMICLNFDFRGYKPEEITVTLNKTERCIVVEACHEVKEGKEHHVIRKVCRKCVLPTELAKVDLAKCEIKSCLTVDGCLTIEMPLPKMTTEEIAKCPIMSRAAVSPLFNAYYRCPSVVFDTKPVACKIN